MNSMRRTWTDEQFIVAVEKSISVAEVLNRLGLKPVGGNYKSFGLHSKRLGVDTSHFTGQSWSSGKSLNSKRPIEDYLNNLVGISSFNLKRRLIREKIFKAKCYSCGLEKWLGKPIALELEHLDGIHSNNSLENLTLLCPNCHSQTETYRGKNIGHAQVR